MVTLIWQVWIFQCLGNFNLTCLGIIGANCYYSTTRSNRVVEYPRVPFRACQGTLNQLVKQLILRGENPPVEAWVHYPYVLCTDSVTGVSEIGSQVFILIGILSLEGEMHTVVKWFLLIALHSTYFSRPN